MEDTSGQNTSFIPLEAKAHSPPYLIHKYFARRPWNVFKQLIDIYSKPGQIILDPFCGGGVVIYEGLSLGRKMMGLDLNPLSIFITRNMIKKLPSLDIFDQTSNNIIQYIQSLYGRFNNIPLLPQNNLKKRILNPGTIEWNELAFKIKCNYCEQPFLLSNDHRKKNGAYLCPNPGCPSHTTSKFIKPLHCQRIGYQYLFSVIKNPINNQYTHIPFSDHANRLVQDHITYLQNLCQEAGISWQKTPIPLQWDRQSEDLLAKKNILYFEDFFTERNLRMNHLLLHFIKNMEVDADLKEIFRLVFSSSLRDTNIMAFTDENWQNGTPITWSKHAFWIPNQFCETNILSAFVRSTKRMYNCLKYNQSFNYRVSIAQNYADLRQNANLYLQNASICDIHIPENSVDLILTDPPYGSNVQYLELSHFWFPWNSDMYQMVDRSPDFSKEAVVNRKHNFEGHKTFMDYEQNLFNVFKQSFRTLKSGGKMILTFNNKDFCAWLALLIAIFRAGFHFQESGLFFQDGVKNYRQTGHTKAKGSPYGDFIYIFFKEYKRNLLNQSLDCMEIHYNEDQLLTEIQEISTKFRKNKTLIQDKNEILRQVLLEIIPKIEKFVNINIINSNLDVLSNPTPIQHLYTIKWNKFLQQFNSEGSE